MNFSLSADAPALADPRASRPADATTAAQAAAHEWRTLASGLQAEAGQLLQTFQRDGDLRAHLALSHLRREFAFILCALPDDVLAAAWSGPMQRLHTVLMDGSLRQMPASEEDRVLIDALADAATPSHGQRAARLLMACNARWPVPSSPWEGADGPLGEGVLNDRFGNIEVHQEAGDAERAARYLIDWTQQVHGAVMQAIGRRDHERALDLARRYAQQANLIQTYFCELNLREVFRQRGELLAVHFGAAGLPLLHARPPRWQAAQSDRIRLGVYVQQLGPGTENFFTLAHLEGLDRSRLDITLFCSSVTGHPVDDVMRQCADRTVMLQGQPLGAIVHAIRAAELDVLLIGNNAAAVTNPAAVLAQCRLAPLQIASVSSPVTTGGTQVDVMLTSTWNEPNPDAADHFVERLERLDGSINYYSYQHDTDRPTLAPSRTSLGIGEQDLVLFSGANFFKLVPEQTACWVRILQQLPGSVLLLMPFNPNWASSYRRLPFLLRLQAQLAEAGLAPDRIRVLDPVPTRADVQRCVGLADLYLDPFPFSGACSLIDPLEVAVPPVVRRGLVGRSQHAASLMRLAGLEDWICDDESSYEEAVIKLGRSPELRLRVREHLQGLKAPTAGTAPWARTEAFAARVGDRIESLVRSQRASWGRMAARPAGEMAVALQALADRALERPELLMLTDLQIVQAIVLPHFQSLPAQSRHLIDVGTCYGSLAAPFLAAGWSADLFEPDPRARDRARASLAGYASQMRLHAAAVSETDLAAITFHKASTDGLSGLSGTPFGTTEQTLQVPCVRLDSFCRREGVGKVDFVKIDAEGHDFDALRSLDLQAQSPTLIMVEYGVHFERQREESVQGEIRRMQELGYEAVVFDCIDPDGQFEQGRWLHRLRRIVFTAAGTPDRLGFGNILFYRRDDRDFGLTMAALLESCIPASQRSC